MSGKFFLYPFAVGQVLVLRKAHPCGGDTWEVLRVGAEVTLRCQRCNHPMTLARKNLEKACSRIVEQ